MKKKFGKKIIAVLLAAAIMCAFAALPAGAVSSGSMRANCVIGYWENWVSGENSDLKLREVDPGWDVIIVSFLICDSTNYTGLFDVDNSLYPGADKDAQFKADVEFCQARGQKVLISVGGATGNLSINSTQQRDIYLQSIIDVVDKFGFDGIDIDFEHSILSVQAGDTLNNPITQIHNYLSYILHELVKRYGGDFIVTMAAEHPYVQGGAIAWRDYYGGYLPLIHLTRDIITFIHPQYYNNSISGYDGSWGGTNFGFSGYNVNSLVKISEMLINGFDLANGEHFDGLRPDQVAIGVPCTPDAAGSGYLPISDYQSAFQQLLQKYPTFRGMMTWSINYDAPANNFVNKMNETIKAYGIHSDIAVTSVKADKSGSVKAGESVTWTVGIKDADGTVSYKYTLMKNGGAVDTKTSSQASYTAVLNDSGTYTLKVDVTDSMSTASAVWNDGITVIAPLSISSVRVSGGKATITAIGGNGGNLYSIYFIRDNRIVKSVAYTTGSQIDLGGLESGTYTVRAYAQDVSGARVGNASQVTL